MPNPYCVCSLRTYLINVLLLLEMKNKEVVNKVFAFHCLKAN